MNVDDEIRDVLRGSVRPADKDAGYRAIQARLGRDRRRRSVAWALATAMVAVAIGLAAFEAYEWAARGPGLVITDDTSVNEDQGTGSTSSMDAEAGWRALTVTVGAAPVTDLAVDPLDPAVLYAATGLGLFKSSDRGGTWVQLFSEATHAVAIDPQAPSTVYACADSRPADGAGGPAGGAAGPGGDEAVEPTDEPPMALLRSDDGGASWRVLDDAVPRVDVLPAVMEGKARFLFDASTSPTTVYYYAWGLRRSTDRGESWTALIPDDTGVDGAALDLAHPGTLYAVSGADLAATDPPMGVPRFLRSTDAGATWEDLASHLPGLSFGRLAVDPADPARLYQFIGLGDEGTYTKVLSTDRGETWTVLSGAEAQRAGIVLDAGPGVTDEEVAALSSPMEGLAVIGGRPPSADYPWGTQVVAAPADAPPRLYAFGEWGVQTSSDAGATWSDAGRGLGSADVEGVVADPGSPRTVYVSTKAGIGKSTDGGVTWFPVHPDAGSQMLVSPSEPTVLYALTREGLSRSDDGGMSWNERASAGLPGGSESPYGLLQAGYRLALVAADTPDTLFMVDDRGKADRSLYRSTDGGGTWGAVATGGVTVLGSLVSAPSDPSVVYASGTVSPTPPDHMNYAAGDSAGVLRSDDGGATWAFRRAPGWAQSIAVDARTPSVIYALCGERESWTRAIVDGRLFRSGDAGATWQELDIEHPGEAEWLAADPRVPGTLYLACTIDRSAARLYRSRDGGVTWEDLSGGWPLDPVAPGSQGWVEWRFAADLVPAPDGGIAFYAVAQDGLPGNALYRFVAED